ncbi:MAG: translation initiation factor IF-2 [Acidobacteria bacterium]|jgi:translation initiation factor IF-2|nr:translation initiation factor IF-2 [Acidobacteriota bacterium]
MAVGTTVRIYDLAKELKQDTKRVIEEVRREGADVSVPSNSVSREIAEKVRNKYFPKTEAQPKRSIKLIKKKAVDEDAQQPSPLDEVSQPEIIESEPEVIKAPTVKSKSAEANGDGQKTAEPQRQIRKLQKKVEEATPPEQIETAISATEEIPQIAERTTDKPQLEIYDNKIQTESVPVAEQAAPKTTTRVLRPTGTQIKELKLTQTALNQGIKPGDRVVSETQATQTGKYSPDKKDNVQTATEARRGDTRGGGRKPDFLGTPGETATPKTVYVPPAGQGKRPGRSNKKGGRPDRGGRFEERYVDVPKQLSIEERLLQQVGKVDSNNLKTVRLTEGATIREFSEALNVTPRDIVQLLVKRGIFATLNQPIGEKMAQEVGENFGYSVSFVPFEEMVIEQEFEELIAADADDVEETRPPVVTVMGHVDHGKTSLLDAIRSDNVAEGEAGGITQHIGAYSVFVPNPDKPSEQRRVVFLDTPGHEAFTLMRARGAKATDVVILVVAADDGVMPQTIEAIEHSKAAGVPIIVAINKVDKPGANADKVKQGLAGQGLQPIDWGGDTEMVEVSAKQHQNLDTLLETVLLTSDILDLKASPTRRASGVVLEAKLDKGRGSVATVLVQQGTLRVGDPFIVGQFYGKVRAMFNDRGEIVTDAPPATPVEVLGLQGVPQAGDTFQVVSDIDKAQTIAGQRQAHARNVAMLSTTKRGIESLGLAEVKELLVLLKTDVQGSAEVLRSTLEKLSTEKVKVRVIRSGVGAITESDVLLASATQADNTQTAVVIIGFNVRPELRAAEVAKQEQVDIRLHSIIYKVEEEIRAAMIGMLDAIEREVILGKALVQEVFKVSKVGTIAGCRVTDGVVRRQAKARIIRDGVVAWTGDIDSLKRFKDDASEVRSGFECGIGLVNFNDIKVDDEIEAFVIESIAATEL